MLLRLWRREKPLLVVAGAIITCLVVFWQRWTRRGLAISEETLQHRSSRHKLCVLVPFRDRFDELTQFVPHITSYLEGQGLAGRHDIFVINQVDGYRFNRASLLNVGFLESQRGPDPCNYVALHDVDLVPKNHMIRYDQYPESGPVHLAAPGLHPKYDYPDFMGGILLLTTAHFKMVNGLSNRYWGWGLEDDEFRARIKDSGLELSRPDLKLIGTGKEDTFHHNHSVRKRGRDYKKCHNQVENTRLRDRKTGLNNIQYSLISKQILHIDNNPMILLNVKLPCDKSETPWCDCTGVEPDTPKKFKRTNDSIMPILPRKSKP